MTIPAALDADLDPYLKGLPLTAYKWLLTRLSFDFTAMKPLELTTAMHCSDRTFYRVMSKLVDRGYVERGPWKPGDVREYKLLYRRRARVA